MQSYWLMEEARTRQAERMAAACQARLRAEAAQGLPRTSLALRTAALLRHMADHLEDQDRLRRFSTR
jgi:hypothetical protein